MPRLSAAVAGFGVLLAWGVPVRDLGELAPDTRSVSVSANVSEVSPEVLTGVVQQYCVRCHNDRALRGNLSLQAFNVGEAVEQAETGEKMINKLRAGMMPPPGARRPSSDTLLALVETLEEIIDEESGENPNPGSGAFSD